MIGVRLFSPALLLPSWDPGGHTPPLGVLWLQVGMQNGVAAVENGTASQQNYQTIQHVHFLVYTQKN